MKFARYEVHGQTAYGIVKDDTLERMTTSPFEDYEVTGHQDALSQVRLLSPCTPTKILALAGNYVSHLGGQEPSPHPEPFLKTPSSLNAPGDSIIIPKGSGRVDEEAELVVVMGQRCSMATRENALEYVLGYTCGNDVSARPWQSNDVQWWRAKSSDTFSPVGPYIETDLDGSNVNIWARVNGEEVQHCNTSELIHDIPTLISVISQVMTLEPGDMIFTGTSGVTAELHPGDTVEVEVEGIGILSNPVQQ